jgi:cytochrome c oxidase subunit II
MVILYMMLDLYSKLFPALSKDAYDINVLFIRYLIFAAFIVLLIGGTILIAAYRFRASRQPHEPSQIFGHKIIEMVWTFLPLVAVTIFFVLTLKTMKSISRPGSKDQKPDIIIIARQWWWDMRYPKENIITANELHIPVGKRLLMQIESADVIHNWWVMELGPKMDAIPGQTNYSFIEADKPGTYDGACSEFCGTQHAWMRIKVVAQAQSDYDQWVREQQKVPEVKDSIALEGANLFKQKTCLNCHAVTVNPDGNRIGPDLSHMGSRHMLLSGMIPNTHENLTRWLENPQKVKEGALMPNFMLSKKDVKALVTYLEGLK